MQYSISSYTCFSLLQPKRNSSVGNDKYKRLEIYTDSTLDTEASLKLPCSLAKQSWQSSLAVKIKLPQPCVWWCLLMYEIWVTILQYEGAGSCCVRATSVDVMIIIIINFLLSCIWLYMGAKTAALANARQVQKLCRHNQSTEFELQRPWDFWSNVRLCPRLRVWHLHAAEWTFLLIHHGMLIYTLQSHGVAQAAYTCGCLNRGRVSCNALWQHALCYDYWLQGLQPTALEVKMLRKLGRGVTSIHTRGFTCFTIYALRGIIRIVNKPWFTRYRQGQTLAIEISYNRTLVHTMCCPRIHDNIEWVPRFTIIREWSPRFTIFRNIESAGLGTIPSFTIFHNYNNAKTHFCAVMLQPCKVGTMGQCQPALQTSCRPQEAWQRLSHVCSDALISSATTCQLSLLSPVYWLGCIL